MKIHIQCLLITLILFANLQRVMAQGAAYVAKAGDTMTGTLKLPANGLTVAGNQLVASGGKVGIGTASPQAKLHVINPTGANLPGIQIEQPASFDFAQLRLNVTGFPYWNMTVGSGVAPSLNFGNAKNGYMMSLGYSGNVGIGTSSPAGNLDVVNSAGQAYVRFLSGNANFGSVLELRNNTPNPTFLGAINFNDPKGNTPGQIAFQPDGTMAISATVVSVSVLQITGGSDVAEPFNISGKDIPKGSLVVIDENNPGQLQVSDRANDTRVAGIVSGANGIKPGISLRQAGALAGGENVALSGRVYALADASNGAIHPGDLLTTSDTPGHCMKVTDHGKAQGAVIGKAMSSLEQGKGMVLVLVSLQ